MCIYVVTVLLSRWQLGAVLDDVGMPLADEELSRLVLALNFNSDVKRVQVMS